MAEYFTEMPGRVVRVSHGLQWVIAENAGPQFGSDGQVLEARRSMGDLRNVVSPILVVDDDPSIREIIVETLELEGYPVEQAANGMEALLRIQERPPSVILLDMRMPVLDGWGLVSALRQQGLILPIVVMTAAKNARTWANEIGASAYLDKPFEDTALLAIVERFHGKLPSQ